MKVYLALAAAVAALWGCGGSSPSASKPGPTAAAVSTAIQSAESYMASQKPQAALQIAAQLVREAPNEMRAHEIHARALVAVALDPATPAAQRAPLLEAAADAYDRAAALEPGHAALQHAAGVVNDTAERHTVALAHYKAAHEAEPGNAQFMMYYGVALARAERLAEAQPLLEEAEKLAPDSPDPKAALADLDVRRKDLTAARIHITQAIALSPRSLALRLASARIRRLDGHPEIATNELMALDEKDRGDAGVAEELALALQAQGLADEAAKALEWSAICAPNDWKRALRASKAWGAAGNPAKSIIWLERAQALGAPTEATVRHQDAAAPR